MANNTQTIVAPTPSHSRTRRAKPIAGKRTPLAPVRGSAKREAAKLREFRERTGDQRTPDDTTVRSSLFGGRRT